jgi:hypothetical protein
MEMIEFLLAIAGFVFIGIFGVIGFLAMYEYVEGRIRRHKYSHDKIPVWITARMSEETCEELNGRWLLFRKATNSGWYSHGYVYGVFYIVHSTNGKKVRIEDDKENVLLTLLSGDIFQYVEVDKFTER